jgi:hypothetical protein
MRLALTLMFLVLAGCEGGKGGLPDGGLGGDAGSGGPCGFGGDFDCPPDEFCDFGRNQCGADDVPGICRKRPQNCDDIADPVCGCDNRIYSNECDANAAGVDVNAFGSCPVPAGRFACGFRLCEQSFEYCQRVGSDIGGEPDGFSCRPLPPCGGDVTCGCLQDAGEPCAENCTGSAQTGLTVTCFGG